MPRLPRYGVFDLTYRCSNNCRHCWVRIPPGAPEKRDELSFAELRDIVDQARAMGCRDWRITGGEPMLRPDFAEIFDYVTRKAIHYTLNTNGTLITPQIAQLMRRKGRNMVAVYGATAQVHDHITRTPGSFERTMRGFAYLKEAGANFEVQLVPMRDNFHQWDEMQALAQSLSNQWRCGAAWLYLSACGDPERNREIKRQRLDPRDVVKLSPPNLSSAEWWAAGPDDPDVTGFEKPVMCEGDDRLLAACIGGRRRAFHVDPYGQMTFCCYIKDPALRYDLRRGSFQEAWDVFIPSLADRVRGGQEYLENCAVCELRSSCEWCCTYAYLEHRRFSAPVGYLCAVARENRQFEEDWEKHHRRYYECAGITFRAESDLPVTDASFHPTLNLFQVERPKEVTISIRHYSGFPNLEGQDPGEEAYRMGSWRVHKKGRSWIYLRTVSEEDQARSRRMIGNAGQSVEFGGARIERLAIFNHDHTRARVYGDLDSPGRLHSFRSDYSFLTLAALAQVLADRGGCFIHSSGAIMDGHGLLFMGHSEAGKSTIRAMLKDEAGVEILGDDRNVIGRWPDGYRVHGVWTSTDPEDISVASAPLRAILWLEQAPENRLIPLGDRMEVVQKLLACLVKPLATAQWWDKSLTVVQDVAREVPCYILRFDLSGGVVEVLRRLCKYEGEA
jgi:MoaA/NifB/PqqE/SkfB family radical SAM enzyme